MKKVILLAAAAVFALVSCSTKKEKQDALNAGTSTTDSLRQVIAQKDNEINDIMGTLNEIQDGFRQINEAEGRVNVERNQGEGSNRQAIIENMAFIQRTMKFNRDLIASLKEQLKNTTVSNGKLKTTIEETLANLTAQMEEKDKQIAALKDELAQKDIRIAEQGDEISNLSTNVANLTSANEEKARTVAAQEKELNTAWYVFGTKKELREQNILKKGDVLRTDNFNKDYFTRIDLRVTKVIKLYSKSAKLMTNHPAGSYSLDKDAQGQYTLRITDPQKFWSVSRYLVVTVK